MKSFAKIQQNPQKYTHENVPKKPTSIQSTIHNICPNSAQTAQLDPDGYTNKQPTKAQADTHENVPNIPKTTKTNTPTNPNPTLPTHPIFAKKNTKQDKPLNKTTTRTPKLKTRIPKTNKKLEENKIEMTAMFTTMRLQQQQQDSNTTTILQQQQENEPGQNKEANKKKTQEDTTTIAQQAAKQSTTTIRRKPKIVNVTDVKEFLRQKREEKKTK